MNKQLEICCYTIESAIKAEQAGADRVELCDNYSEGGTTPSYAAIKQTVKKLNIPVNVIVRPRGGDFLYSQSEFEIIKEDVIQIKKLNTNGIVIGLLKADGSIDLERTSEIVDLAGEMEVTFHRAFDMCKDQSIALEQIIELGITRVLTSGGMNTAEEGITTLKYLVQQADNKIIIMPGSGVNKNNIAELVENTSANEFHSSAKLFVPSQMNYYNPNINMGGTDSIDEYKKISIDEESIESMKAILRSYNK